jgi:hypothetical protein
VPWYAETKQAQGSYSTLVGVEFCPTGDGWVWNGVAVGDSCLFHVRGGRLETSFPVTDAAGFGTRPPLVQSRPVACPSPVWRDGHAHPGDLFLLATDAVAAHLLATAATADWLALVDTLRTDLALELESGITGLLHDVQGRNNDDASLVVIQLGRPQEALI